jgi:hypothetical protein
MNGRPNKIKKRKCYYHDDDRDLTEYVFWVTDIRRNQKKKYDIDIWECKKCKENLERDIAREKRMREHNDRQRQEAIIRSDLRHTEWLEKRNKSMREDIWDSEIRNELCKGLKIHGITKYKYKESIPKDILRLKRAQMKLERLIDEVKRGKRTKKQIETERLTKHLVDCKKHGKLFLKDVIKGGKSKWTDEQLYKCRKCMSDLHRDYYDRKKEYVREKQTEYRMKYPEKRKETAKKYRRKFDGNNNKHEAIT